MLQSIRFDFEKANWTLKWSNEEKETKGSITVPAVPKGLRDIYERLQYYICVELYEFPTQQDARLCSFAMNDKQVRATFCLTIGKKVGEYVPSPYNLYLMPQNEVDTIANIREAWDELVAYFVGNMEDIFMVKTLQKQFDFDFAFS